ncbi:hypothetical protein [Burkholderia sp. Ac-20344]|uniref:hypothetical protein n=1 Tax=Burkholderia sp. Ac-20344 TaxID=2703890 RepID=UPI00197BFE28|nr:hypothetical protein [Burkholderia sp. Ac-20344]MBN3836275.1 hypothetical protein [Burkholderia sp. Ac-20344]
MSRPLLPSGRRRGLPFVVPDDWTPEQALAVFELLEDLLAVVTDFYGVQLHELLHEQRHPEAHGRTRERDPPF